MKNILKKVICFVVTAAMLIPALGINVSAAETTSPLIAVTDILFSDSEGSYISSIPSGGGSITATVSASQLNGVPQTAILWIAAYKDDSLVVTQIDKKSLKKKTDFSAAVTVPDGTNVVKAGFWDANLTPFFDFKSTSSIKLGKSGSISNVKQHGAATSSVYGVPMLAANPIDIYGAYSTDDERIAAIKNLAGTICDTNVYQQYSNRSVANGFSSSTAGYAFKFTLGQKQNNESIFYNPCVTRLFKSDTDFTKAVDYSKVYEFDIDQGAQVYITMSSGSYSSSNANITSTYIESLDNGWEKDYNPNKYGLYRLNTKEVSGIGIPLGSVQNAWGTSGTVYYKHFNAGSHVEIPAVAEPASSSSSDIQAAAHLRTNIFIVWDSVNADKEIFDITANGKSIGFDKNVLSYNVDVGSSTTAPIIAVEATAAAEAEVIQASSLNDKAYVIALGKTYEINFTQGDMTPGVLENVKMAGAASAYVYGRPSLGAANLNLYDVYYQNGALREEYKDYTIDDMLADMRNPEINPDINSPESYTVFNDRINTDWRKVNNRYGDQYRFALKDDGNSMFVGQNVTRLYKPSTDPQTYPERAYEFTVSKGATVYITVPEKSEYIESLNKGWKFDANYKYMVKFAGYKEVTLNGEVIIIPNGGQNNGPYKGLNSVYYKHFNAGENVEIPVYNTTESYYKTAVYVLWDNLSDSTDIYDICVNGKSIGNFNDNTYEYTYNYELGSGLPVVSVSAAGGANASVIQATDSSKKALVKANGKTYTINFVGIEPNTTLKELLVNNEIIPDFNPDKNDYNYVIARGVMDLPVVKAAATLDDKTVEIKQVTKVPGTAKVFVKTESGYTNTYTINFVKTGTPGEITNLVSARGDKIYAVPSLAAEPVNHYAMFETDDERFASAIDPNSNPYWDADKKWAQYTDRNSGAAWTELNFQSTDSYGGASEFTLIDNPGSMLISPDVTRIFKSSTDATGDKAEAAYTFNISKGATVYLVTSGRTAFLDSLDGWEYEFNNKYKIYRSAYKNITNSEGKSNRILTGGAQNATASNGTVYKKHFTKDELVTVPAYSRESSYKQTNIFVVWDECNDDPIIYGANYSLNGESNKVTGFDSSNLNYDITLPSGTTELPVLSMDTTGAVGVAVSNPTEYTNGKAVAVVVCNISGETVRYTFNFYIEAEPEKDIRLKSMALNGENYDKFNTYTRDYSIDLPLGTDYPTVSAVTYRDITPEPVITQASDENGGVCSVNITSKDGTETAVYIIRFTKLDYIPVEAELMPVKDGKKSIVTIVHDDGAMNTVRFMNDEFAKNNLKGTIAIIGNVVNNSNKAEWQAELDKGRFNIANHSYTHKYWGQTDEAESGTLSNGSSYNNPEGTMTNEIINSGIHLRNMFPNERVLCFVKPGFLFPIGMPQVSATAYKMIGENYISMRNTGGGTETIPPADKYNLKSLMVQANESPTSGDNHTAAYWKDEVDKAVEKNGWLIFLFHHIVDDDKANGLSVAKSKASILFEHIGQKTASGDVWNAYLDEASMYTEEAYSAKVTAKDFTEKYNRINVSVADKLDDSIYDYPLTIKTKVPSDWNYIKVVQNGKTEIRKAFTEGENTYVYANVVPDKGEAELTKADSTYYLSEIKTGENTVSEFDPTNYFYKVTLPAGTTAAPTISASSDGNITEIKQATLTNGEGSGFITLSKDGQSFVYEVHFSVDKTGTGPVVFLKFDDLREGASVRTAFKNAIEYLDTKGVKANVGVIAVSLENDNPTYYNEIKGMSQNGHEIWCHGYYHDTSKTEGIQEFKSSYEKQTKYLTDALNLIENKCGIKATSFGAPGNATDSTTTTVINNCPQIKATYFGPGGTVNAVNLTSSMAFEVTDTTISTWTPILNYKNFVAQYSINKSKEYLLLQTHPLYWGEDKNSIHFKVFRDQIDYLISQGAVFMTASEYADNNK